MHRIIAVIVDNDDSRAIEAIAPHVLAMQDLGYYTSEAEASDALVDMGEDAFENGTLALPDA